MTLKSHPGKALVRGGEKYILPGHHNGEQAFLGDAKDAHTVKWEGKGNKYIRSMDHKKFWLEIPRNQHDEDRAMWFRTLHSSNDDYFAWVVNENGTISSKNNDELVLGYGISENEEHWKDLSNHYEWKEYKTLKGFEPTTTTKGKTELGRCLKVHGEEDRWVEIPYGTTELHNFAWLRTHHGGGPHFDFTFNKDGTISPFDEPDIVWGLDDPSPCSKWRDVIANHVGWSKSRAQKREADKEKDALIEAQVEKAVLKIAP